MYAKVIKAIEWVLLAIGVVLAVFGYAYGFTKSDGIATDILIYCAYALIVVAILAVIGLGLYFSIKQNPKSLIKLGIGAVVVAAIVGVAYVLAPGTPAVGSSVQTSAGMLKLTDTILNITYFACGAAVVSILVGVVMNAVRNK